MATIPSTDRTKQALLEVGETRVSPAAARVFIVLFLATIYSIAIVQMVWDRRDGPRTGPLRELAGELGGTRELLAREGWLAANRGILAAIDRFESRLEEESFFRDLLLPPMQALMTESLGLGNEQVYPGRQGWLFYRPDIDYVTGRGFLEGRVLRQRSVGGDPWRARPQPDPLVAITSFARDLEARGILLLVLPTPLKPMIEPERLSGRGRAPGKASDAAEIGSGFDNPSYALFVAELGRAGIEVLDVTAPLLEAKSSRAVPQYLRNDTHWTPEAMEVVAKELATRLEATRLLDDSDLTEYLDRPVVVENLGDVAVMLHLPQEQTSYAKQAVTTRRVLTPEGRPWRADPRAQILLLGDSFSNVYSDPRLGWGGGAGLVERLSFRLRRPVDKLALNAGGSHATRQALARELAAGSDRLEGKKIVVYQFAMRELAIGDWKGVEMSLPQEAGRE